MNDSVRNASKLDSAWALASLRVYGEAQVTPLTSAEGAATIGSLPVTEARRHKTPDTAIGKARGGWRRKGRKVR